MPLFAFIGLATTFGILVCYGKDILVGPHVAEGFTTFKDHDSLKGT
jgi:hypothetical protein